MSTRGFYTFIDDQDSYNVYKHSDNYPSGAYDALIMALPLAWRLPRYEADEFACAFIAGNKDWMLGRPEKERKEMLKDGRDIFGGGLRFAHDGRPIEIAPGDIEYRYEIRCMDGELYVKAFSTDYWEDDRTETEIFSGTLAKMKAWSKRKSNAA